MGKPEAPTPPDPQETATAQTSTNLATAQANAFLGMVDQVTPDGTLTYNKTGQEFIHDENGSTFYQAPDGTYSANLPGGVSTGSGQTPLSYDEWVKQGNEAVYKDRVGIDLNGGSGTPATFVPSRSAYENYAAGVSNAPGMSGGGMPSGYSEVKGYYIPRFTATQRLSEMGQRIKDQSDEAKLNFATLAKNQSGRLDDVLSKPFSLGDLNLPSLTEDFSADRQRVEDALMSRLNPQLEKDRERLRSQLSNQGIKLGSTAYDRGLEDFGRQSNDARFGAILNAGTEQQRLQAMALAARQQGVSEAFAERTLPVNEITALLSGSQVQQPNFVNTQMPTIPTVDKAGLINENFNQQMGIYQQKAAQSQQMLGGLFGLGSSLIGLSDRRAKTDIKKVGKSDEGHNIYAYRYKTGGPMQLGLMAQEVEKKQPDAVLNTSSGLKAVDYGKALQLGAG